MDLVIPALWCLVVVLCQQPTKIRWNRKDTIKRTVFGAAFATLVFYFWMPTIIWRTMLILFGMILLANGFYSLNGAMTGTPGLQRQEYPVYTMLVLGGIMVIGTIIGSFVAIVVFDSDEHHLTDMQLASSDSPNLIIGHNQMVSSEDAVNQANRKIGETAYKEIAGTPSAQFAKEGWVWIIPNEHSGWMHAVYYGGEGVGGYMVISAENSSVEPRNIRGLNIRYLPSGVFGYDLERLIYMAYPYYWQRDPHFQLDDRGNPVFVVTLTVPAFLGTVGEIAKGVVVVDSTNGSLEFYPMNETPAWIEMTIDAAMAEDYVDWWSKGKFWEAFSTMPQPDIGNLTAGARDIIISHRKSSSDVANVKASLVRGTDNRSYWFMPVPAPASNSAVVGYVLVDIHSWPAKAIFYPYGVD